jgi:hypothetical protein
MGIPIGTEIDENTDRGREGDLFVPDGKYYVKVLTVEEREKKGDEGVTFIHAEYEIVDAEDEAAKSSIGLRVFDIFSLGEAALWKIAKFLDCCYAPNKFKGKEIPDDIEGKEFVLRAKNEKYQGNVNLRVKAYMDRFDWSGATMKTNSDGEVVMSGNAKSGSAEVSV